MRRIISILLALITCFCLVNVNAEKTSAQEDNASDYLCFTALENEEIGFVIYEGMTAFTKYPEIQYSVNSKTDFKDYEFKKINKKGEVVVSGTQLLLNVNDTVYFRAKNTNDTFTESSENYIKFVAKNIENEDGRFNTSGNIMSLVDSSCLSTTIPSECYFMYLFSGCSGMMSAPKLPATKLTSYCYYKMFDYCTSLINAPELPATIMKPHCYDYMFSYCTSLTNAPALPSKMLAVGCYSGMFNGCTSLVDAPELPAKILAPYCYMDMFFNCEKLQNAPALPSMILADGCYSSMFYGCESLVDAPKLPATSIKPYSYHYMFANCISMVAAPKLPAKDIAECCYSGMFSGCTNLIYAPELPARILAPYCYQEMFLGCINLNESPALPARILAPYCYEKMFLGCESLIKTPNLPAKVLEEGAYKSMFSGCTNLVTISNLPATQLAPSCYQEMFHGCENLIKTPDLPVNELAEKCYSGMFYECKKLLKAPKLPATQLAPSCYQEMFYGCESLETTPDLPAKELTENCYKSMFTNCVNLKHISSLPAITLKPNCYALMFNGCTELIKNKKEIKTISTEEDMYKLVVSFMNFKNDSDNATSGMFGDNITDLRKLKADIYYYLDNEKISFDTTGSLDKSMHNYPIKINAATISENDIISVEIEEMNAELVAGRDYKTSKDNGITTVSLTQDFLCKLKAKTQYTVSIKIIKTFEQDKETKHEIYLRNNMYVDSVPPKPITPTPDPGKKDESCEKVIGPTWHWNNTKGVCEEVGVVGTATR